MTDIMKEFISDKNRTALFKGLEMVKANSKDIVVIETGTIRNHHETSRSTIKMAEYLKGIGNLISVDLNQSHINISKEVCKGYDNIEWVQSDSLIFLKAFKGEVDLCYLDSVNDKDHIYNEFVLSLPILKDGGVIIIDDYHRGQKCNKVVDVLKRLKYPFEEHKEQILISVTKELKKIIQGLYCD